MCFIYEWQSCDRADETERSARQDQADRKLDPPVHRGLYDNPDRHKRIYQVDNNILNNVELIDRQPDSDRITVCCTSSCICAP